VAITVTNTQLLLRGIAAFHCEKSIQENNTLLPVFIHYSVEKKFVHRNLKLAAAAK
jgi:hypothetical protein